MTTRPGFKKKLNFHNFANQIMKLKLKSMALHSIRYGVSDHGAAEITLNVLQDTHLTTDSVSSHLIDKNEKRRTK